MRRWLARLDHWSSAGRSLSIQQRMFFRLSLLGGLLSVLVVVPVNLFQKLPAPATLVSLAFGLLALGIHWQARRGRYLVKALGLAFVATIDTVWFFNAGSMGPMTMLLFLGALYAVVFFQGLALRAGLALLLVNGVALHLAERLRPTWVVPYPDPSTRTLDLMVTFVISTLVCSLVLWMVLTGYREERARLEQAAGRLREAEAQYRLITEHAANVIALTDIESGRLLYVSSSGEALTGYAPYELLDMGFQQVLTAESAAGALRAFTRQAQAARLGDAHALAWTMELDYLRKDGRIVPAEVTASMVQDAAGQFTKVVTLTKDITARREAASALRESEERYRTYVDVAPDGVFLADASGRYLDANPAACQMSGYDREELLQTNIPDLIVPEDFEAAARHFVRVREEGRSRGEFRFILKNGAIRWWHVAAVRLAEDRLLGFAKDITEQRQTEQALRDRERDLRTILDHMQDAYFRTDLESRFVQMSPSAPPIFGYGAREELLGAPTSILFFEPDSRSGLLEVLQAEGRVYDWITRGRRKDGSPFWVSMNVQWVRRDGRIVGKEGIIRDITPRKEAEAAAHRLHLHQQAILDNLPMMAWLKDPDSRLVMVNAAYAKACGRTVEECLGKTDLDLFPRELAERYMADDRLVCRTRRSHQMEEPIGTPEGLRWAFTCKTPLLDEEGRVVGTTGVALDITERRRMEEENRTLEAQYHHLLRMESVGRLAGGVAHDMNNVLSAIMAVASIIKHRGGAGTELAQTILEASERGRHLVQGLLEFARKGVPEADTLDLNDLVRREAELLAGTTMSRIRLDLDLAPDLPPILGSATALSTALMNLCVNAVDAMPEGGVLSLRTAFLPGQEVQLDIEDTGTGMSKEVADRAVEPFFTTKPAGKGTGLGLSMVFGTIQSHGGTLHLESEEGRGTRVRIRLPMGPGRKLSPLTRPEETASPSVRPSRILLVDDDPLVRETAVALLDFLGHRVTGVRGGREALELVRQVEGWDVMLLDLNMPDLDGIETLRQLRAFSALPVIMATGYADEKIRTDLGQFEPVLLLTKPYTMQEVQRALQGILLVT